jgi:gliding motility-associated-like protein
MFSFTMESVLSNIKSMLRMTSICLSLFSANAVVCQNLVQNGSFEDVYNNECAFETTVYQFPFSINNVKNWSSLASEHGSNDLQILDKNSALFCFNYNYSHVRTVPHNYINSYANRLDLPPSGNKVALISLSTFYDYNKGNYDNYPHEKDDELVNSIFHCRTMLYGPTLSMRNTLITNQLSKPIVKGKRYKVGFFVTDDNYADTANIPSDCIIMRPPGSNDDTSMNYFFKNKGDFRSYITDGLGILLSTHQPEKYIPGVGTGKLPFNSKPPQFRISEPFMSNKEWTELSWEYVAEDTFTHLTIGNFWSKQQQKIYKWKFCNHCNSDFGNYYLYYRMVAFIDSVYLIEIGSFLPDDTIACIGSKVSIKENLGRKIKWILEDDSEMEDSVLKIQITKPVTRIIGYTDNEYDTMYVYGKEPPTFTTLLTDSLCAIAGRPYNRMIVNSPETGLQVEWNLKGVITTGFTFESRDTGEVFVTVTDSIGCKTTKSIDLKEHCFCPVLPPDTIVCLGSVIQLRDLLDCNVIWHLEDGSSITAKSIQIEINQPETRISVEFEGRFDTMYITGKPAPEFETMHTDSLCIATGKIFNRFEVVSKESPLFVDWSIAGKNYSGFEFVSSDTGKMKINVTDSIGCITEKEIPVEEHCPEFTDFCPFPNAFSPNGDGLNDVLSFRCQNIKSLKIMILNRWGEIMFNDNNLDFEWDGTYKGQQCQDGIYTVVMEYEFYTAPGVTYLYRSNVHLLR